MLLYCRCRNALRVRIEKPGSLIDAVRLASMPKRERDSPREVAGLLLTYLRDTRRYLAGNSSGDALFIGWQSGGIGEKDWGLRMARIKSSEICP